MAVREVGKVKGLSEISPPPRPNHLGVWPRSGCQRSAKRVDLKDSLMARTIKLADQMIGMALRSACGGFILTEKALTQTKR
jgi:error-prone DNA polymerase